LRVPLTWLHEYLDFDQGASELVDLFSLYSQEIDGVYRFGVTDGEVVVGEVLEFGPHPNADRLFVARVDLGGREVQIVAGASNPYPGARVAVVLPSSVMADGTKLKKARLRSSVSPPTTGEYCCSTRPTRLGVPSPTTFRWARPCSTST
jgi:phenylalanyl-tRNA synthetase beta chain